MKFRCMIILAGMLILTGCATLNKEQCLRGDWRGVGWTDGMNGEPAVRIEQHREACAEYGVRPDQKLYMDGRAEGLRQYCELDNAFQTGLDGKPYKNVCPPDIHPLFLRYHNAAYEVYQARRQIEQLHDNITYKYNQMESRKTSKEDKIRLRRAINDDERKLDDLRNDLRDRERWLDRLMAEARRNQRK